MIIRIVSFTPNGKSTREKIIESLKKEMSFLVYDKEKEELSDFCRKAFVNGEGIIFVSAAGIATRSIAPFVEDKLKDPPVIVCDELGQFVIPILSGHYGGANELAMMVSEAIDALPVITTGTDVNKAFSVDVFARENDLKIINRDGISKVSTKAIAGKPITISIENFPPNRQVDVIVAKGHEKDDRATITLSPRGIVIGIGCKKGKEYEEIRGFLEECLDSVHESIDDIAALATIDIKGEEEGIKKLSSELSVPIFTFDREVLNKVQGNFAGSEFVKDTVGVDNVCERAAVAAAGTYEALILKKQSKNGMTIAIAKI